MHEGWVWTRLGEMLSQVRRTVTVSELTEVPFIGVRWYVKGAYHTKTVPSSEVKTKTLKVVREGDVIYYKEWATKGSFAVAGKEVDGCMATSLFPVFTVDTKRVLTRYLEMAFRTADFLQEASDRAVGTTDRRALKEPDFLDIKILLPPLEEQQRIVDLIGSLDDAIEAADAAAEAARMSADGLRQQLSSQSSGWPTLAISALTEGIVRGAPAGDGDFSYIDISSVSQATKQVIGARSVRVSEAPGRARQPLRAGDVLVSTVRPNLNAVALVPTELEGSVGSTGFSVLRGNNAVVPGFLFQVVRSTSFIEAMSGRATGTGYPAVTDRIVREFETPVPPLEVQRSIVETLEAFDSSEAASGGYADSLRATRSELLTVLLSGEHEIPESYDIDTAVQLEPAA